MVGAVILIRSILFNLLFYLNLLVLIAARGHAGDAALGDPRHGEFWGRTSVRLLSVICGTRVEFRGLEKIGHGPLLVAAKHQSTWRLRCSRCSTISPSSSSAN